jgi:DNA uptake protein ComE-like DNA-binding protein
VATGSELADLGFTPAMAKRIETYRSKGGKFRIKSDLLKIYGMDTAFYKMLYAFIDLPDARQEFKKETASGRQSEQQVIKEKFDLNLADTTQLKKIYGIGSKLSARIVKYRESLGGFISMNQLQEVYGLDSVVIKEIRKNTFINPDFSPRTISVNTATEKELSAHPYINYSLAKAITTYRFQHGKFSNPDELRKIQLLNETTFEKIKPYLSLTP